MRRVRERFFSMFLVMVLLLDLNDGIVNAAQGPAGMFQENRAVQEDGREITDLELTAPSLEFDTELEKPEFQRDTTALDKQIGQPDFGQFDPQEPQLAMEPGTEDMIQTFSVGTLVGRYNNITWTLNRSNGALTISGSGEVLFGWADQNGNLVGAEIKTVTIQSGITAIGDCAFVSCPNLTSVSIPSGVKSIGEGAFGQCTSLRNITLPDTVTSIGKQAFFGCTAMTGFTMSSNIQTIADGAFTNCAALTGIHLPAALASIGEAAFANCTALVSVQVPEKCTEIKAYTFYNCTALANIGMPRTLKAIGEYAFACTALTALVLPDTVTNIGNGAFGQCMALLSAQLYGTVGEEAFLSCESLAEINILGNCASIGDYAFQRCISLRSTVIPAGCVSLGVNSFAGNAKLEHVNFNEELISIGDYCFYACPALKDLDFPDGLQSIGKTCFGGDPENGYCSALDAVTLPAALTSVGEFAFEDCRSLVTVDVAERFNGGLSEISNYAFVRCEKLESICIPFSVEKIGNGAFAGCYALSEVLLPDALTSVGGGAFGYCEALSSIELPASCTEVGSQAFYHCISLRSITLSNQMTELKQALFYECSSLEKIVLPQDLSKIGAHVFFSCHKLVSLTIPDGVREIGKYAFYDCEKLKTLKLPENLQKLEEGAFIHCASLKEMRLPDAVLKIPDAAFLSCENLENVQMSQSAAEIGAYAFCDCPKLEEMVLPAALQSIGGYGFSNCESLQKLTLPDKLVRIGDYAFANSGAIQSLSIPASLADLGDYVFAGCRSLSNLTADPGNAFFREQDGVLFSKDFTTLYCYPPALQQRSYTVPDSVTVLKAGAFYTSSALEELRLPSAVAELPDRVLYGCSNLHVLELPDSLVSIGDFALGGTALSECRLPGRVHTLGAGVFEGAQKLRSVALPAGLKELPAYAFSGCQNLQEIEIPESVQTIGAYAFARCASLSKLELPTGLSALGEGAFSDCALLTSMVIPAGVECIEGMLCYGCQSLESVLFQGAVYAIGNYAFQGAGKLQEVRFAGNAPETIGTDAFLETHPGLTFFYDRLAEGWSVPQWTGPDGNNYKTATLFSGKCGDGLTWSLSTHQGLLHISGSGAMYSWTDVQKVPWYQYKDMIYSVQVEEGVTNLGSRAFMDCANLMEAEVADSVKLSGYGVFAGCKILEKVTAPNGLHSIGRCMFYGCSRLCEISIAEDAVELGAYAFYNCSALEQISLPMKQIKIPEGVFANCISLERAEFAGEVKEIDSGAFYNCQNMHSFIAEDVPAGLHPYAFEGVPETMALYSGNKDQTWTDASGVSRQNINNGALSGSCGTGLCWQVNPGAQTLIIYGSGAMEDYEEGSAPWYSWGGHIRRIVVESGVTEIGNYAFANLDETASVSLPVTLERIGKYAMAGCGGLEELTLPEGVRDLGEGVWSGCISLQSIHLPEGLLKLPDYSFTLCESLSNVRLPGGITQVGYGAFYGCSSLETLHLPENLIEISDWGIAGCTSLQTLDLPDSLRTLGKNGFYNCSALKKIAVPGAVAKLSDSIFEQCTNLKEVSLNGKTKTIGRQAFYGCTALEGIELAGVEIIGEKAFMGSGLKELALPESLQELGEYAFADCGNLAGIVSQAEGYFTVDGVLYTEGTLVQYPAGKKGDVFNVPEHAARIGNGAFYGNAQLHRMTGNIEEAGDAAFAYCSLLESVSFGKSLKRLGKAAFGHCSSLDSITFSSDAPEMGEDIFYQSSEAFTLYWFQGCSGWTDGLWTAPDGSQYHAQAVEKTAVEVSVESAPVKTEYAPGEALELAGLVLKVTYNDGTSESVPYTEETSTYFSASGFDSITAGDKMVEINYFGQKISLAVTVKEAEAPVKPKTGILLTLKEETEDTSQEEAQWNVHINTGHEQIRCDAVLVLAVYREGKMLSCAMEPIALQPESDADIRFAAAAENHGECTYQAFLLGQDYAPLTKKAFCKAASPLPGYSGKAYIRKLNLNSDEFSDTPMLASARASETEPLTQTTVTFHVKDIVKDAHEIANGTLKPEVSKEESVNFDISTTVGSVKKTEELFNGSAYNIPFANVDEDGNVTAEGMTSVGKASGSFKAKFNLTGIDYKKLDFKRPEASLGLKAEYNILHTQIHHGRDWERKGPRAKDTITLKVGGVEAGGDVKISMDGFTLGAKAGVDVVDAKHKLEITDSSGGELFSFSLGLGVGASANASASVGKDTVKFKLGAKAGVGGSLGLTLHPAGIIKELAKSVWKDQNIRNHLLLIKAVAEDDQEMILAYKLLYFDPETQEIVDIRGVPLQRARAVNAAVEAVLPQNNGGTKMPDDPELAGNGGNASGNPAAGKTDEENKAQNTQRVTLTTKQKNQILAILAVTHGNLNHQTMTALQTIMGVADKNSVYNIIYSMNCSGIIRGPSQLPSLNAYVSGFGY